MGIFYRIVGFLELVATAIFGVYAIVDIAKQGALYNLLPVWLWIIILVVLFLVAIAIALLFFRFSKVVEPERTREEPNYYTGEKLSGIKVGDKVVLNYSYDNHQVGEEGVVLALRSITAAVKIGDDTVEVNKAHLRLK